MSELKELQDAVIDLARRFGFQPTATGPEDALRERWEHHLTHGSHEAADVVAALDERDRYLEALEYANEYGNTRETWRRIEAALASRPMLRRRRQAAADG